MVVELSLRVLYETINYRRYKCHYVLNLFNCSMSEMLNWKTRADELSVSG